MITDVKGPSSPALYVPVLKAKQGEFVAVRGLDDETRAATCPLFEVAPPKSKSPGDHIEDVLNKISKNWSRRQRFYLDTVWLDDRTGTALEYALGIAHNKGLGCVPVLGQVALTGMIESAHEFHRMNDECGICIRLNPAQAIDAELCRSILDRLRFAPSQVDLIVDYESDGMNLASLINNIPWLSEWRTVITASGAARGDTSLPEKQWHSLPRRDWTSWQQGVERSSLDRLPLFSDYATRSPGKPAEFGDAPVSLVYCADNHWLFRWDSRFQQTGGKDIYTICDSLTNHHEFSGEEFSTGDREIYSRRKAGSVSSGNPASWISWAVNHHITMTVQQLRSVPGFEAPLE